MAFWSIDNVNRIYYNGLSKNLKLSAAFQEVDSSSAFSLFQSLIFVQSARKVERRRYSFINYA